MCLTLRSAARELLETLHGGACLPVLADYFSILAEESTEHAV